MSGRYLISFGLCATLFLACAKERVERDASTPAGADSVEAASADGTASTRDQVPVNLTAKIQEDLSIYVSWSGLPGRKHDWIGVYAVDEEDPKAYLSWIYVPEVSGADHLKAHRLEPGQEYVLYALADNDYETYLGKSEPFRTPDDFPKPDPAPAGEGETIDQLAEAASFNLTAEVRTRTLRISWQEMPGGSTDWIGVYREEETDPHKWEMWTYAPTVEGNRAWKETALKSGKYRLIGFKNNTYSDVVGISEVFTYEAR